MIKIQLVRVNGRLVGRTFSDRWNLAQLGYDSMKGDRNQSELKKFRRFYGSDFKVSVVKGCMEAITDEERGLFQAVNIRKAA